MASAGALALVVAGAAALLLSVPALLGLAGGTSAEVASVLARAARPPVELGVPGSGAPLVGRALHFQRVTVSEEGTGGARAVSTLDFEGSLGGTRVSSLGRETTRFRRRRSGWEVDGSIAPALTGAVAALTARRRALEGKDAAALAALVAPAERERVLADPALRALLASGSGPAPRAWLLRSEASEVTVTEEGDGRPPSVRRLRLVPRSPGSAEFVFAGSLL
ncbi:MAG TPA: hypothetical protein VK454_06415 [Myxococcaceae bacterium]|nr:hypothetical protein [Myxococcaceae bacterium]